MHTPNFRIAPQIRRISPTLASISALFLFMGLAAPQATHADDARTKCQHSVQHARDKLDKAVRDHGDHSPQADKAWMKLRTEREKCFTKFHEWWDAGNAKWRHDDDWTKDPRDHDDSGPGHR